ncbi:MAG TPA: hypothetical protein VFE05_05430 [Longimicrobiaceae bacterium]|jgi:hypothetical protein|nr:hypothetical protein [Longimicrobiaceae bacterium]
MRKLTLQVDALNVDSFVTEDGRFGMGTVLGQEDDTRVTEFCTMKTCIPTRNQYGCVTYTCQYQEDRAEQPEDVRVPE